MLIGINGAAGAGKDSVANILVKDFGFKRYAFADAVREMALAIDPLVGNMSLKAPGGSDVLCDLRLKYLVEARGWDRAKRENTEVRRLLQVIGTEAGRQLLGENVWVDVVSRKWNEDGRPNACVTDMRFPNEFDWVENIIDEVTLKIVRPDNPDAISTTHASEQHSFDCRFELFNDRTLEDLRTKVGWLIRELIEHGGR